MTEPKIYIDWRFSDLTLSQMIREIEILRETHPEEEIFMDGELHAIVGMPRRCNP